MKKLYALFLCSFFVFQVHAQEMGEWLDPVAVTDSNSINSNPFVWVDGNDISVMFYEKKPDESSNSMIYKTELNGDGTEYPLLSEPGINYSQPFFHLSGTSERAGFLLYLADPNGKLELFATEYMKNGILEKTFLLASEEENIDNFNIPFNDIRIGWISQSNAYVARVDATADSIFLDRITLLDSLACSNIKMSNSVAAWEKQVEDSIAVKYSSFEYNHETQEYEWTDPVEIDLVTNEPNISMSQSILFETIEVISWVDGQKIRAYNAYDHDTMTYKTYNVSLPHHPTAFLWYTAVKAYFPDLYFLCFDGSGWGSREIFCSQMDWYSDDIVLITQDQENVMDINPDLFGGEFHWSENAQYVYCIWQSHRNGKVPLYMSKTKADIGSGVEENKTKAIHIDISPNPFSSSTQIAFKLKTNTKASLSIFSGDGQLIETKTLNAESASVQYYNWYPKTDLAKGIYIVTISQDGIRNSAKLVYK